MDSRRVPADRGFELGWKLGSARVGSDPARDGMEREDDNEDRRGSPERIRRGLEARGGSVAGGGAGVGVGMFGGGFLVEGVPCVASRGVEAVELVADLGVDGAFAEFAGEDGEESRVAEEPLVLDDAAPGAFAFEESVAEASEFLFAECGESGGVEDGVDEVFAEGGEVGGDLADDLVASDGGRAGGRGGGVGGGAGVSVFDGFDAGAAAGDDAGGGAEGLGGGLASVGFGGGGGGGGVDPGGVSVAEGFSALGEVAFEGFERGVLALVVVVDEVDVGSEAGDGRGAGFGAVGSADEGLGHGSGEAEEEGAESVFHHGAGGSAAGVSGESGHFGSEAWRVEEAVAHHVEEPVGLALEFEGEGARDVVEEVGDLLVEFAAPVEVGACGVEQGSGVEDGLATGFGEGGQLIEAGSDGGLVAFAEFLEGAWPGDGLVGVATEDVAFVESVEFGADDVPPVGPPLGESDAAFLLEDASREFGVLGEAWPEFGEDLSGDAEEVGDGGVASDAEGLDALAFEVAFDAAAHDGDAGGLDHGFVVVAAEGDGLEVGGELLDGAGVFAEVFAGESEEREVRGGAAGDDAVGGEASAFEPVAGGEGDVVAQGARGSLLVDASEEDEELSGDADALVAAFDELDEALLGGLDAGCGGALDEDDGVAVGEHGARLLDVSGEAGVESGDVLEDDALGGGECVGVESGLADGEGAGGVGDGGAELVGDLVEFAEGVGLVAGADDGFERGAVGGDGFEVGAGASGLLAVAGAGDAGEFLESSLEFVGREGFDFEALEFGFGDVVDAGGGVGAAGAVAGEEVGLEPCVDEGAFSGLFESDDGDAELAALEAGELLAEGFGEFARGADEVGSDAGAVDRGEAIEDVGDVEDVSEARDVCGRDGLPIGADGGRGGPFADGQTGVHPKTRIPSAPPRSARGRSRTRTATRDAGTSLAPSWPIVEILPTPNPGVGLGEGARGGMVRGVGGRGRRIVATRGNGTARRGAREPIPPDGAGTAPSCRRGRSVPILTVHGMGPRSSAARFARGGGADRDRGSGSGSGSRSRRRNLEPANPPTRSRTPGPMKTEQFLKHHGIGGNPFSEEDAQTDTVFKVGCLSHIHHPAWNKFFGSPSDPSTALIFGEKGSGKTALRLQATAAIEEHNRTHPENRVFLISYDDFNPFLDHFGNAVKARDIPSALAKWTLNDHIDAILALGVTKLIDEIHARKVDLSVLSADQARDLLLLAALHDQSTGEAVEKRWARLRRRSGFRPIWSRRDLQLGAAATIAVIGLTLYLPWLRESKHVPWMLAIVAGGWLYWAWRLLRAEILARDVARGLRVLDRDPSALRSALLWFNPSDLAGQPLPRASRAKIDTEARYELLRKFQGVLKPLGYTGVIVVVDRVDEPQLVEGDPRRMRTLVWPLLDNKFLRHPGIGTKLLMPIELAYYLEKEDREFYERARPDKLNMIKPLRWTGPSLYDLATDRLRACQTERGEGKPPIRLRDFIDPAISDDYLRDALGSLRTPRQLFKFLHRLIEEHCHRHTEDTPRWTIDADTFRTVHAAHLRDLEAFDRGYGHG